MLAAATGWAVAVGAGVGVRVGAAATGVEVAAGTVETARAGVLVVAAPTGVDVTGATVGCALGVAGADAPTTTEGGVLVGSDVETVRVDPGVICGSAAASTLRSLAAGRVDNRPAT